MGPLFFRAENRRNPSPTLFFCSASMGPLFFRAENHFKVVGDFATPVRFNGAALFQSGEPGVKETTLSLAVLLQWGRSFSERKTWGTGHHVNGQADASMGPLFFRAENVGEWCGVGRRRRGFNGAALFQSGEQLVQAGLVGDRLASMGPLFFRAENQGLQFAHSFSSPASMGPLFFRAENEALGHADGHHEQASMGPLFFRAENVFPPAKAPRTGSFNGAALFQSGEHQATLCVLPTGMGLQWGRSFSERRTGSAAWSGVIPRGASMGPLFFRAENTSHQIPVGVQDGASMGPLFFRAENIHR